MFLVSAAMWALTDDRAGHNAHTRGLANGLGVEYEEKALQFSPLARLPSGLFAASPLRLRAASRAQLCPPWPALVVASGRRMLPVMRHIRSLAPRSSRLIGALWPGEIGPYDLLCVPEHDDAPEDARILRFTAALHGLNRPQLRSAGRSFQALFERYPEPHIGVMIGGHSKHGRARVDNLHHLLDTAEYLAGGGTLFITTSRRTPLAFLDAIAERLTCGYHLHVWGSEAANPYLAMLDRCDALCVSGDSISMMAECCFSGKPVLIDVGFASMRPKHLACAESLFAAGHAAPLRANSNWQAMEPIILDERPRMAAAIKSRLHL